MLKEHARVKELVEGVRAASAGSRTRRVMSVMNELELHAKVEEEVLYPAALLAGVFVKGGMKVEAP